MSSTSLSETTPSPPSLYNNRQQRFRSLMHKAGLKAVVLNPGPSLMYLTGLSFHLMERPVLALFSSQETITIVSPELEAAKTAVLEFPNQVFFYGENPAGWLAVFNRAFEAAEIDQSVGVEPTRLRYLELELIRNAAPKLAIVSAETCLAEMRMRKDQAELELMQKAVEIAETALLNTLPEIKIGVTERQIAAALTIELLHAGADPEFPFSPIVSGGPNSANPHASPTDRPLSKSDLLVIDWGALYHGYCSDLTRTFAIHSVEAEYALIADLVLRANAAGRGAGKPGLPASAVDHAAREVITKAGYGEFFTHRTGHGLGMEGHEAPYMHSENHLVLESGMTYTVEPGIYLPGRGGVRIEDNVVVTDSGAKSLSSLSRELAIL